MKDYKEVAADVFQRSEIIIADNRRRNNNIRKAGSMTVCFCLVILLGASAWQRGAFSNSAHDGAGDIVMGGFLTTAGVKSNETIEGSSHSGVVDNEEEPPAAAFDKEDGTNDQIAMGGMAVIMEGIPDTEFGFEYHYRTMISSYGDGGAAAVSYDSPENGTFKFSIPLKGAIDEYGASDENGDILYRVLVYVFKDKNELNANSDTVREEGDRLFACGYTVAMETYNDGHENHYYFTLHATKEQLVNFAVNEEYGYRFFLYDELVPEY